MSGGASASPAFPTQTQLWLLAVLSVSFLVVAPDAWRITPDSGVYVGTAQTLAETGRYRFNGHPNLLYYPGFPGLLCLPILVFGMDFQVLHLLCAAVGVLGLWLARSYFPADRYGWTGLLIPFLLAANGLSRFQFFTILSEGTFLTAVLAALLLWRRHQETSSRGALLGCIALTAYASLVRFQGLFLVVALAGALGLPALARRPGWRRRLAGAAAAGLAACAPFALWTWRNFVQHTPDTFNMGNQVFFGLEGLTLYAPGYMRVAWIDQEWLYGVHNLWMLLTRLAWETVGSDVVGWAPPGTVVVLLVAAVLLGGLGWFRRASRMERIYVALSLVHLLWDSLTSGNLYVVPRYWLPVLPFLLASAGLGLGAVRERLTGTRLLPPFQALLVLLLAVTLTRDLREGPAWGGPEGYWIRTQQVLAALGSFVQARTPPDAAIATSDWGVLPWALQRTSYQVLNDASHLLTLERIDRYQTSYLVILETGNPLALAAQQMVRDLPHLFTEVQRVKPRRPALVGSVYTVDLEGVARHLERRWWRKGAGRGGG